MASIFSRIVSGEIPAYKVAENDNFLAFLDIQPLAEGHVLVIPKEETDYIFDIENQQYMEFFLFAKKVALAVGKVIPCKKVGMAVVGLEVPHAHIHLVPMNDIYDLDFSKTKLQLPAEKMKEIAEKIHEAFSGSAI
jgi:histidine triad (HIT) family protein